MECINKIICGDNREIMFNMPDNSVDLIFTDPPYNKNYPYKDYNDNRIDYWDWLQNIFIEINRVLKPNSSIYVKQDLDNIYNMMTILNKIADYKNVINWKNQSQGHPPSNYDKFAEIILFYTKGKPIFNTYAEKRIKPENYWSGCGKIFKGKMSNYWDDIKPVFSGCVHNKEAEIDIKTNKKYHSCQMPTGIAKRAILFSSNKGDIILDPFVGSGTTAVACIELKRKYIGIDNNKEYCEIATKRIKAIPETLFDIAK